MVLDHGCLKGGLLMGGDWIWRGSGNDAPMRVRPAGAGIGDVAEGGGDGGWDAAKCLTRNGAKLLVEVWDNSNLVLKFVLWTVRGGDATLTAQGSFQKRPPLPCHRQHQQSRYDISYGDLSQNSRRRPRSGDEAALGPFGAASLVVSRHVAWALDGLSDGLASRSLVPSLNDYRRENGNACLVIRSPVLQKHRRRKGRATGMFASCTNRPGRPRLPLDGQITTQGPLLQRRCRDPNHPCHGFDKHWPAVGRRRRLLRA